MHPCTQLLYNIFLAWPPSMSMSLRQAVTTFTTRREKSWRTVSSQPSLSRPSSATPTRSRTPTPASSRKPKILLYRNGQRLDKQGVTYVVASSIAQVWFFYFYWRTILLSQVFFNWTFTNPWCYFPPLFCLLRFTSSHNQGVVLLKYSFPALVSWGYSLHGLITMLFF